MRASGSKGRTALKAGAAALLVALLYGASACGGDDDSTTTSQKSDATGTTVPKDSLLGTGPAADGTPVKVGLITNGGECSGCGNGDDEPVARATVDWLNEKMNGLGGHPMELVVCVDSNDPGPSSDCANKMISEDVAAVIIGTSGIIETPWKILHDAGIPVINSSTTNAAMLEDAKSTYLLNDPEANTVGFPIGVAKKLGVDKISIIVVDVPAATDIYKTADKEFEKAGLDLQLVPVPLATPDMTPQAQQVLSQNSDGLVMIVGHDQFCIPAIQGLEAVGFTGPIATISYCVTDAMRTAIPGDVKEGIQFSATAPIGDDSNKYMQQYAAVLDTYASGENIDPNDAVGVGIFQSFGALNSGTQKLTGEATPASVNTAMHSMDNAQLLASGINFRCGGKASATLPGVCSVGVLAATLDADGNPVSYTVVDNDPIKD